MTRCASPRGRCTTAWKMWSAATPSMRRGRAVGDRWPVQKCQTDQRNVTKYSPETSCREVSRQLCAPAGCAEKHCQSCETQVKAVVASKPVEECDMEPQKVCRHMTKMLPRLEPVNECVQVPHEVCGVSKTMPVKKTRPVIQNWCYDSSSDHQGPGIQKQSFFKSVDLFCPFQ